MSSVFLGSMAEDIAVEYLKKHSFKIIDRNWKNRYCEIDIIASKQDRIHFVEVKYRKTSNWGDGLTYITPTKLEKMLFAASNWIQANNYNGDYCISAISVSGNGVEKFVDDILF